MHRDTTSDRGMVLNVMRAVFCHQNIMVVG